MEIGDMEYLPNRSAGIPHVYIGEVNSRGKKIRQYVEAFGHVINPTENLTLLGINGGDPMSRTITLGTSEHSRLVKQLNILGLINK